MAEIIASRPMTVLGREYKQGERIPAETIAKLPPQRLKQLVDQRRVAENSVRVSPNSRRGG